MEKTKEGDYHEVNDYDIDNEIAFQQTREYRRALNKWLQKLGYK